MYKTSIVAPPPQVLRIQMRLRGATSRRYGSTENKKETTFISK